MSMKTGCYQDLSIGGITVMILTHEELEELRRRGKFSFSGGGARPYQAPTEIDKWRVLNQGQEQKYFDRRE